MAEPDDLKREIEALRARIATLNAAILKINASLDLDTVLGEVVESARALTSARWDVIATVDEAGAPGEFVFLGFTPEEQLELYTWPDHARLFEHFRELPGPLRVDDLSAYAAWKLAPRDRFIGWTPHASPAANGSRPDMTATQPRTSTAPLIRTVVPWPRTR